MGASGQVRLLHIVTNVLRVDWIHTLEINMESKNGGLEDDFLF